MKKNLNAINQDIKETLEDLEAQMTELLHSDIPDEEKAQIISEIAETNKRALSTSILPMKLLEKMEINISKQNILSSEQEAIQDLGLEQSQKRRNDKRIKLELKKKDSEE